MDSVSAALETALETSFEASLGGFMTVSRPLQQRRLGLPCIIAGLRQAFQRSWIAVMGAEIQRCGVVAAANE
jgi:hypothetical protein